MILQKQNAEIVEFDNPIKFIEYCGRVTTQTQDKITDKSYEKFIKNLETHAHGSVLEQCPVYLKAENKGDFPEALINNKYVEIVQGGAKKQGYYYLYANLRCFMDSARDLYEAIKKAMIAGSNTIEGFERLSFFTPKIDDPKRRITVHFVTDKRIETESVRHRVASPTVESSRYVNFAKRKWDVSFIDIRPWLTNWKSRILYKMMCYMSEWAYKMMIKWGEKPQWAATVFLYGHKSEMFYTQSIENWMRYFNLRCTLDANGNPSGAHPLISQLADWVHEEMVHKCILKFQPGTSGDEVDN